MVPASAEERDVGEGQWTQNADLCRPSSSPGRRGAPHHGAGQWQGSRGACPVSLTLSPRTRCQPLAETGLFGTPHFLQRRGSVRQAVFFLPLNPETIGCSKSSAELLDDIFEITSVESITFQGSCFDQNALQLLTNYLLF